MIKLNKLFWQMSRVASVLAIFGLLVIASCSKDDEDAVKVATVEFTNEAQTVAENGTPITINIPLSRAAGKDGTITISITEGTETVYGTHLTTSPNGTSGTFELAVAKGQTSAQFTFSPINNALLADDKTVVLAIEDVSSGFEIGTKDSNTITITDDEGPTQVNFALATSSTAENTTAGIDVTLNLSSAAPGAGTVTVAYASTNAAYTTNFTTEPAATAGKLQIAVTQGATSVTFKVKPVDDGSVNAPRTITFSLDEASGAVALGTAIATHTFTITDDETPSVVSFAEATSSVSEGEEAGITIPVNLDPQTNGSGTVAVTFTGGTYGTDFTTEPAAASGKITISLATGVTTGSFKVIPVDNDTEAADKEIIFTLSEPTGIVTLGSTGLTHELTIEDDDAVTTIASIRALGSGATIPTGTFIEGVVVSEKTNLTFRNIFIQDASAGILIRLGGTTTENPHPLGQKLRIAVGGKTLATFDGLLQIDGPSNTGPALTDITDLGPGVLPTPEVITLEQALTNAYQGRIVKIENVFLKEANGTKTMSGNITISDGTREIVTFTRTSNPIPAFATEIAPLGAGSITGVMTSFGGGAGTAQIHLRSISDIDFDPAGSFSLNTTSVTDFGSIDNGDASAGKSFTISGTGLLFNIDVTAPTNFEVSLTEGSGYADAVEVTAAAANANATVYVRFAPESGENGLKTGNVTVTGGGVAPQTFVVNGTEAGNTGAPAGGLMLTTSPLVIDFNNLASGLPASVYAKVSSSATSLGTDATPFGAWAATAWNQTNAGFKNFASATGSTSTDDATVQAANTNRALGIRQTGTAGTGGDPGAAFVFELNSTAGKSDIELAFKLMSLDATGTNTRVTTWTVEYAIGLNPTSFTAIPAASGTLTTTASTFTTSQIVVDLPAALNNVDNKIWIRIVALTATTGAGSRPSTAIDDVTFTW